jgi:glycosyltransferase involved in cell wall biosynthesis
LKISIVTPFAKTHERFLVETYESLKEQTFENWEWLLLANGGGMVPEYIAKDQRVKVYGTEDDQDKSHNLIGRLKYEACFKAGGEIIVELDADDLLLPDALAEVVRAFEDQKIVFAYSNNAMFKDATWETERFSEYYGWKYRSFNYKGRELAEAIAWEPSPHMMRFIYWAPDHLRAWRADAYWKIGGHDKTLPSGDDHDLCCRLYIQFGGLAMCHIDKCLYLYRLHDKNHWRSEFNAEIQRQTLQNYLKYSRDLAVRWAKDEGLKLIDLGGRFGAWEGFLRLDKYKPADIVCDLEERWPLESDSVGVLRASHIFEHLYDPVHTMNEAYRVLAPGGWLFIEVPSTDGRGAFQDPTHRSLWNENSFLYYTDRQWARFIQPQYKGRFQVSRVVTYFPTEDWRQRSIPVVQADLIALKAPYSERPMGEIKI